MGIKAKIKEIGKRRGEKPDEFWRLASHFEGGNTLPEARARAKDFARRGFDVFIIEEEYGGFLPEKAKRPTFYLLKSRVTGEPIVRQLNRTYETQKIKQLKRRMPRITPQTPRLRR